MSLKNEKKKPANQVQPEQGLTTEQHLGNLAFVIEHDTLTISGQQRKAVIASYLHIKELLEKVSDNIIITKP